MFDSYELHSHRTQVVDRHVTVNKAPTDKSVELLKEMQEQIKQDFLGKFTLENNLFQATVMVMEEAMMQNIHILVRYKINYEEREVTIVIAHHELLQCPESASYEVLSARIINEIAQDLAKVFVMYQQRHGYNMPMLEAHRNPIHGKNFTLNVPAQDAIKNPEDANMKVGFIQKWLDMSNPSAWALREKLKALKLF